MNNREKNFRYLMILIYVLSGFAFVVGVILFSYISIKDFDRKDKLEYNEEYIRELESKINDYEEELTEITLQSGLLDDIKIEIQAKQTELDNLDAQIEQKQKELEELGSE